MAVLVDARLDPHQHRVAPAVGVEDLLAGEGDGYRPAGQHAQLRDDELVRERVDLAAEAAAQGGGVDVDLPLGEVEGFGEGPVDAVRTLGRGPEVELAPTLLPVGEGRVLLEGDVGVALVEVDVLADVGGLLERRVDVAEVQGGDAVGVPELALVDELPGGLERALDGRDGLERLVGHVDAPGRLPGRLLVEGGHGRDRLADVPDLVNGEGVLVLADREGAEGHREVLSRDDGEDAVHRLGRRRVDVDQPGVGLGAPLDDGVGQPGPVEVAGVPGLAGGLLPAVHARVGRADDVEGGLGPLPQHPLAHGYSPRAVSSMASTIFV